MAEGHKDIERFDGFALDTLPRWLRDMIDINNEIAGRETGRAKRFSAADDAGNPDAERKKDERRINELLRRLQDPEYAQLYKEAAKLITNADEAVERALRRLERDGELAAEKLDGIKSRAAELPDGRKVFQDKDGRLIAEDGSDVTDKRDTITGLSEGLARWEDYESARKRLEDIERRKRELRDYRDDVLEPARDRLSDPENPPSKEELEDIIKRVRNMPADARAELMKMDAGYKPPVTSGSAAAKEHDGEAKIGPDMLGQFRLASADIPDESFVSPAPNRQPKA